MKSSKVLEMINRGEIEVLKGLLRDEIYQDALKAKPGAKQRYAAMKKYFGYVKTAREVCQKPAIIEFEGKTVTSFCNSYTLVLTTEPCGAIELYTDTNYPEVGRLVKREGLPEQIDLNKALANARSLGYKPTKKEVHSKEYMLHYNGAYFNCVLVYAAYSIINDGGLVTAYHSGKNTSPIIIENDIGVCLILPVKCDADFIAENGIKVIDIK
jgi:hypothetical protein